jgi:hypothetical protein
MKVISIRNQAILQFVRKINEGRLYKNQGFLIKQQIVLVKIITNEKTFVIQKSRYFLLLFEKLSQY